MSDFETNTVGTAKAFEAARAYIRSLTNPGYEAEDMIRTWDTYQETLMALKNDSERTREER